MGVAPRGNIHPILSYAAAPSMLPAGCAVCAPSAACNSPPSLFVRLTKTRNAPPPQVLPQLKSWRSAPLTL